MALLLYLSSRFYSVFNVQSLVSVIPSIRLTGGRKWIRTTDLTIISREL